MRVDLKDSIDKFRNSLAIVEDKITGGDEITQEDYLSFYEASSKLRFEVLSEFYAARNGEYPKFYSL